MRGYIYSQQAMEEDRILWAGIILDDKVALGQLFDAYVNELLFYGYRISKDVDLIKDSIQDIFVDLWTYRANLNQEVQVKFYLYRCLRNAILKQTENRPGTFLELNDAEQLADPGASPESQWLAAESDTDRSRQVVRLLRHLSVREKEIVSLKYFSGLKIREIASLLELKEQTVANTLQNALVKLRKHLVCVLLLLIFS